MIEFLTAYATWQLILAMIIAYFSAWVWYADSVFGKIWRAQQPHRKEEDYEGMGEMLVASAVTLILSTAIIIIVFDAFGKLGFLAFLLASLAGMYASNSADGGTRTKWLIDGGYVAMQYIIIVIGLIASAMYA